MATKKLKSKAAKASAAAEKSAAFTVKNASKVIMEQAEHIWLAGLGAFSKAQEQGGKVFETLIKEGQALEKATRDLAGGRVEDAKDAVETARDAVESTVSQVRDRASDTWDRLEKVFEDRVSKALNRLGVPGPTDLAELAKRVEELSKAVRALEGGQRGSKAKLTSVKSAPRAAAKKATTRAAAKPRAAAKAASKTAAKPRAAATKAPATATKTAATKAAAVKKAVAPKVTPTPAKTES